MSALYGLTLQQPWATCIVDGPKRIENRTWKPAARMIREGLVLAVHAGKSWDRAITLADLVRLRELWPAAPDFGMLDYPRGAILGLARVSGFKAVYEVRDPWAAGPWCWVLDRVVKLPVPVECGGGQGLWRLPVTANLAVTDALLEVNTP